MSLRLAISLTVVKWWCVVSQWKALPKDIKDRYEERARVIAMDSNHKKISEMSLEIFPYNSESRSMSPHISQLSASGTLFPQHFCVYFIFQ